MSDIDDLDPDYEWLDGTSFTPGRPPCRTLVRGMRIAGNHAIKGAAKCAYCGRYGDLGACAGCGAPNAPAVNCRRMVQ